jgi:restriction alleviation protein Lar
MEPPLMTQETELKRCPFCKNEAYIENCVTEIVIRCKYCPAEMQGFDDSAWAIEAWNRRA